MPAVLLILLSGCAPLAVGGVAVSGYKTAADERAIGRIGDVSTLAGKKNQLSKTDDVKTRSIDVDT